MCRGQHLYVILVCGTKKHGPEIALNGVVDAILGLVDKQKSSAAVCQRQRNAKQPYRTISQTL